MEEHRVADDMGSVQRRPSRTRIVALGLGVAIAVVGVGLPLTLLRFRGDPVRPGGGSVPEVVNVTCRGGATEVTPDVVRVQRDGVHFHLETDLDRPFVNFFWDGRRSALRLGSDRGRIDGDFSDPFVPPGPLSIECATHEVARMSEAAVSVQLIDPEGFYGRYPESLSCGTEFFEWAPREVPFFYAQVNPLREAVLRSIPGVTPEDRVVFAGYPTTGEFGGQPIIVRGEQVVGLFDLSTYGQRTFVLHGWFCTWSGLGAKDASPSGLTATPFSLPNEPRCDPYAEECSPVFVSAARYTELTGEEVELVPPGPWAVCDKDTRSGCVPDAEDMVVQILATPSAAEAFVARHDCGASEESACI
jgi:hypothetical protein